MCMCQAGHATSVVSSNITALRILENLLSHVHMHKFISSHKAGKHEFFFIFYFPKHTLDGGSN